MKQGFLPSVRLFGLLLTAPGNRLNFKAIQRASIQAARFHPQCPLQRYMHA
jgi:hypothetical protein